ncbi:tail fiber assembly protein [Citrobacter freundii]
MNEFYYSPTKNAFYCELHQEQYALAGTWPDDAVAVDESVYTEFAATTAPAGKMRVAGTDGMPAWGDIPPPTRDELTATAENERQRLLAYADVVMQDWRTELMLGEISDANRAKLSAWLTYKNEVKTWDINTDPEHVNWPVPPEA